MHTYIDKISSRERLTWLGRMSRTPEMLGDRFDPEELSFVHPSIAITCWEGAAQVVGQPGYYVINVAEELNTPCDVKIPVNPRDGVSATRSQLDKIAGVVAQQLEGSDDTKIIVHCAMGVERSALAVAWFLRNWLGYGSLTAAYDAISAVRPIVADRSGWAGEELDVPMPGVEVA